MQEVDEALQHAVVVGHADVDLAPVLARRRTLHHTRTQGGAAERLDDVLPAQSSFGRGLRGTRLDQPVSGGQIDGLQHAVDGPSVVAFREHGLDDARALARLSLDPVQVPPQRAATGLLPGAALVEDEPQPPPQITQPALCRTEFEEPPLAQNALEHLTRRETTVRGWLAGSRQRRRLPRLGAADRL